MTFTVADVARSQAFYEDVLGFQKVADVANEVLVSNGAILLGVRTAPDPGRAVSGDRFDENRAGMDHLTFSVGSRSDLEHAVTVLDERNIPYREIGDHTDFGISDLFLRDPDAIQPELTAPPG